jgi:hypothetical protein
MLRYRPNDGIGVPTVPDYTLSPQGIETIFAANGE